MPHVTKSDNNDSRATKHHITRRSTCHEVTLTVISPSLAHVRKLDNIRILSRLLLRCRHGHVYFSDTSCEHDQMDGWVVALRCVVSCEHDQMGGWVVEEFSYLMEEFGY